MKKTLQRIWSVWNEVHGRTFIETIENAAEGVKRAQLDDSSVQK